MDMMYRIAPHYSGRFKVSSGNGKPHFDLTVMKDDNKLSLIEKVLEYASNNG